MAPVVNARRTNADKFKNDIGSFLNNKTTKSEMELQLKNADDLIVMARAKSLGNQQTPSISNHVPSHDEYFDYDKTKKFQIFNGNHFQIEEAIDKIMKML